MKIMNPEERFERIERQLEFMAGIQAQLFASQQRHDEEIAQNSRQISQLAEVVSRLVPSAEKIEVISGQVSRLAEVISTLVRIVSDQGNRMEAGFRRVDERLERTDEQMRQTDERLRALITVFERHLSNGRHGASQ